jgi:hypothetical protein
MTTNSKAKQGGWRRARDVEDLRMRRLEVALEELDQAIARRRTAKDAGDVGPTLALAEGAAARARDSLADGRDQVAWSLCQQAHRFVLQALPEAEREVRRKALGREAQEKLSNWRRAAVLDVLDGDGASAPESLAFAQFLLDQHFANVYFKLNVAALRFMALSWLLAPAVVALLVVSFWLDPAGSNSVLRYPGRLAVVMLVGAAATLLSNTLSQAGLGGRIPDFLGSSIAGWSVRPFIGALSAVLVCVVVQSGLLPLRADDDLALYGWAAAAGFSDQLVNLVMQRVETAAKE